MAGRGRAATLPAWMTGKQGPRMCGVIITAAGSFPVLTLQCLPWLGLACSWQDSSCSCTSCTWRTCSPQPGTTGGSEKISTLSRLPLHSSRLTVNGGTGPCAVCLACNHLLHVQPVCLTGLLPVCMAQQHLAVMCKGAWQIASPTTRCACLSQLQGVPAGVLPAPGSTPVRPGGVSTAVLRVQEAKADLGPCIVGDSSAAMARTTLSRHAFAADGQAHPNSAGDSISAWLKRCDSTT